MRFEQYLSLLQGDLALFLTANKRPVTPEHLVSSPHQMSIGCWEKPNLVLNYPLKSKSSNMNSCHVERLHSKQEDYRASVFINAYGRQRPTVHNT